VGVSGEVAFLSLLDVAERIRRGELSSQEVTSNLIDRIRRHDDRLNSVLLLRDESALADASRADAEIAAGFWRGPLHGVPVGLKDMIWTAGDVTTGGMAVRKSFRPTEDATVVKRLKRAGAVILAKHHTTEGATRDHHPAFGRPASPWSAAHWPGASSSGSGVATAAGFCYAALGTDTAGSIRVPSCANGLTGLKPTWGRVSRFGVIPLAESLDHVGPMARSATDVAAVLQAIAGPDAADQTTLVDAPPNYLAACDEGLFGLTIGIDWEFASRDVAPEVQAALREAAEVFSDLGARVKTVAFPVGEEDAAAFGAIMDAEAFVAHEETFASGSADYGERLRRKLESGPGDPRAVARAYLARMRLSNRFQALFCEVDLMLTPLLGGLPPTWDEIDAVVDGATRNSSPARFTWPYSAAGLPALAFPAGWSAGGLPIGLELAAGRLQEGVLLRAGAAFQRVTDHHSRHPAL
jgi:amidase